MNTLDTLIQLAAEKDASDLHILPHAKPTARLFNGTFFSFNEQVDTESLAASLLRDAGLSERFHDFGDVDISRQIPCTDGKRFLRARINVFKELNGIGLAVRLLPSYAPTIAELGLPTIVHMLLEKAHGLILFSAPTGNGKSTSIAALLETLAQRGNKRIITIEDPIEYRLSNGKGLVSQREVGTHCPDFSQGLKAALREDPDVLMVGEMRDTDTIQTALMAAETGHLVFSTLHAPTTSQAVDRLTQYFPAEARGQILAQFANAFLAILAQKLFPRIDKQGRCAAFEVLLNTPAIANLIRQGKTYELTGYMSRQSGMQTMEDAVANLRCRGVI